MDPIASLLSGPRAQGAFVLRGSFEPPWSLRIEDRAPLTVVAVVHGSAALMPDAETTILMSAPDVAVLRGPDAYVMGDVDGRAPMAVIGPDQVCRAPDGGPSTVMGFHGLRAWGNSADGSTQLLVGTYLRAAEVSRRLLDTLPPVVIAPGVPAPLLDWVSAEAATDSPGQDAVLDRLVDLLLVATLRAWFASADAVVPGWYAAHDDPLVGPALASMHAQPAAPWTVGSLAAQCGSSRAAFARRFRALVGESPITYLTDFRLGLAADLLAGTDATLESVARQVGYANAFALSTAFKRVRGVSPRDHRRAS